MTKVFKFGGASVKNADGVIQVVKILNQSQQDNLVVVVSAMGKTTNLLEKVVQKYLHKDDQYLENLAEVEFFHFEIINKLFSNSKKVTEIVKNIFSDCKLFLKNNPSPKKSYVYDQVVSFGELLSTIIVSEYLTTKGINNKWLDARNFIKTNSYYRGAVLNWEITSRKIKNYFVNERLIVTQGFIGSDDNNFTTTLGREGSDYSAAIIAYCIDAHVLTIWKDVPGLMNGDPKVFGDTQLIRKISYEETIELAFYGASVIHPKTLQPLQKKEIPLHIKSFINPEIIGTVVEKRKKLEPKVPCFIQKNNLSLIQLSSRDFSFIVEENISYIFKLLDKYKMSVDLIQNSAISFSVCVNDKYKKMEELLKCLRNRFDVNHTSGIVLYTIRYFNKKSVNDITKKGSLIIEQRTNKTIQLVMKPYF